MKVKLGKVNLQSGTEVPKATPEEVKPIEASNKEHTQSV